jgi:hypothetical protein
MGQKMKSTTKKTTQRKKRKEPTDPFAFFKEATADAFHFLVTDYSFEHISTTVHTPECAVKYWNETTGVTITCEWGGAIWVDLSRLKRTPAEVVEGERYSLDILMLERCPNKDISHFLSDKEWSNEHIKKILLDYADVLKECGHDVLKGDFQIFPKLKNLAEDVLRQRNKELFGSESGETM